MLIKREINLRIMLRYTRHNDLRWGERDGKLGTGLLLEFLGTMVGFDYHGKEYIVVTREG